jgi:protein SCO1/2
MKNCKNSHNRFARLQALVLAMCASVPLSGQQQVSENSVPEHHAAAPGGGNTPAPAGMKAPVIPDVVVVDQDNHKLHFYRDLVQGKTVAINFIFTTCTTICPPLTANFAKVQKTMMERNEKDLHLISVSVDPEGDTPKRLKNYAEMFHAEPGWTFVTGKRADLEQIWKAFNIYLGSKQDHPAIVAIGNDSQHLWTYASGLTSASKLINVIASTMDGGGQNTPASAAAHKENSSDSR